MTQNCSEDPRSTKNYRTYISTLRIQALTEPCDILKRRFDKINRRTKSVAGQVETIVTRTSTVPRSSQAKLRSVLPFAPLR